MSRSWNERWSGFPIVHPRERGEGGERGGEGRGRAVVVGRKREGGREGKERGRFWGLLIDGAAKRKVVASSRRRASRPSKTETRSTSLLRDLLIPNTTLSLFALQKKQTQKERDQHSLSSSLPISRQAKHVDPNNPRS